MVDAQPVEHAVAKQLEHLAVDELEGLLALYAHRRHVVDVEEAPVEAGLRIDVEDLGVGPPAVLVARAHVVGDDVEHDPDAVAERAQLLLATELARDRRGIDDVVAVRRA